MLEVELSSTDVPIEPGKTAQLDITVTNKQSIEDLVAIELEGIDLEWYALPVPSLTLEPGASKSARVIFRVGRSSDVVAGTYPFLVRVRGMDSGEVGVQQAALQVKPFSALQLDLEPKRATSTLFNRAPLFELQITNLGNREETLDLYGTEPEDQCAFEFEKDRVTVAPGASVVVQLAVEPKSRPLVGSARLYQFSISARSVSDAYVTAAVTGQLERKAVLSTVFASLILLAAVAALGFYAFRPRPVVVRSFTAEPTQVMEGDPVTLAWDVENPGSGSYISPGNILIKSPVGSVTVKPKVSTTYKLTVRGGGKTQTRTVQVIVTPKPPPPKARIIEFKADMRRIHPGDVVTLSWNVEGAVRLVLNPIGALNPRMDRSRQVMPETTTTYVLSAEGADEGVVTKSVEVEVVPENVCLAEIRAFRAEPSTVVAGNKAVLKWSVDYAANIEIDNGIGGQLPKRGQFEVMPATTTVYTLRASDKKGNVVTRQVTVTVTEPPEEPAQPSATVP